MTIKNLIMETVALEVWRYGKDRERVTVSEIRKHLDISDRMWRKISLYLRDAGLLEVPTKKDCERKQFNRKLIFKSEKYTGEDVEVPAVFDPLRSKRTDIVPERGFKGERGKEPAKIEEATMTPDLAAKHRERFLSHFSGIKTFQTFDDNKSKRGYLSRIFHGKSQQLDALNGRGAGVFMTINETDGKGRKRENITGIRAVFVDLDGAPVEPVLGAMPHMVVESSPGKYHGYWFVKDFPIDGFKATQQRLAEIFNGDKAVNDVSRVMRVPGYWHLKGEPFCSRIVFETKAEPLTYAEVVEKFPPKPVQKWSAPKNQHLVGEHGEYTGPYGTSSGGRNNGLTRFVGGMVKRHFDRGHIENEAMKWGKSCSPAMDTGEIMAVVNSVGRYL